MSISFLTITFLYFFFHNPESLICTSEDRFVLCSDNYTPVCALYSDPNSESPTSYLLRTEPNGCSACSDPSILGYIIGDCPNNPVQTCSNDYSLNSCPQIDIEGTVCGITQSDQESSNLVENVFNSGCEACVAGQAAYYLGGETLGECRAVSTTNICTSEQRNVDNCEWSPIVACAYYQGGDCTEPLCRKTMDNYCVACSDPDVLFYLNGDCADLVPIGDDGVPIDTDGPPADGGDPVEGFEEEFLLEEENFVSNVLRNF